MIKKRLPPIPSSSTNEDDRKFLKIGDCIAVILVLILLLGPLFYKFGYYNAII